MKSWNRPQVPRLPGVGTAPILWNTATRGPARPTAGPTAALYVCGITPYDATHIGHAATYLAFDTLVRVWLDAGLEVTYAQNTTDIDDPLLERATATGVDWRELAADQTELFRGDMEALSIIPPDHFVAVTDEVSRIAEAVALLDDRGLVYPVASEDSVESRPDLYFDSAIASERGPWFLGIESQLDREAMLALFAQRGGDPDRPGKRDPLDPLLWRAARPHEPSWTSVLGDGRPGWHIECSVIATDRLGPSIAVQGGGSDLVFPHHEFTAAHASGLTGRAFADVYTHTGMVGYEGEKMSKSRGNLVLVSKLVAAGVDPQAIRLALLDHHYREDRNWTDDVLALGVARLASWRAWAATADAASTGNLVIALRAALANDLDTAGAIRAVDEAVHGGPPSQACVDSINALLGVDLRR